VEAASRERGVGKRGAGAGEGPVAAGSCVGVVVSAGVVRAGGVSGWRWLAWAGCATATGGPGGACGAGGEQVRAGRSAAWRRGRPAAAQAARAA